MLVVERLDNQRQVFVGNVYRHYGYPFPCFFFNSAHRFFCAAPIALRALADSFFRAVLKGLGTPPPPPLGVAKVAEADGAAPASCALISAIFASIWPICA